MNRDEAMGKVEQIKGKTKQVISDLTDDERLRNEGQAQEDAGAVQEGIGRARRKVGSTIEEFGKRLKR